MTTDPDVLVTDGSVAPPGHPGRPTPRVEVCLGAGGVGKTTVAAALAVAAASGGRRAVVLTIDPAHRLADVLGLGGDALDNEPRLVSGPWSGELWAAMLDPAATLDRAISAHRGGRPLDNRLLSVMTGSLSGTNEYMAAERLHQLHHDRRFDHIVIDTPPSRHAIDFLDSPGRLARFVDNRLFSAVLSPGSGRFDPAAHAARLIGRLVSRLVGSDLVEQVAELFAELDGLAEGFRLRADETAALLTGPECGYVLVTSARREPVRHARWIVDRLDQRELAVTTVVANRLSPYGPEAPEVTGGRAPERAALTTNLDQLAALAASERQLVAELTAAAGAVSTIELTERIGPVASLDQLVDLAGTIRTGRR